MSYIIIIIINIITIIIILIIVDTTHTLFPFRTSWLLYHQDLMIFLFFFS